MGIFKPKIMDIIGINLFIVLKILWMREKIFNVFPRAFPPVSLYPYPFSAKFAISS
jgi:hypothetical protein